MKIKIIVPLIITILLGLFGFLYMKKNDDKSANDIKNTEIFNYENTETDMADKVANAGKKAKIEQIKFENWQLVKIVGEDDGKVLGKELVQTLTLKEQNNARILQFSFIYDKANEKLHARTIFPLGVYLPAGFGIKIGEKEITKIPYLMCDKNGCMSDVIIENDLVDYIMDKEDAIVAFLAGDKKQINLPLSLKGFKKGLKELKK